VIAAALTAREAILFVTESGGLGETLVCRLAEVLQRLRVQAGQQRVVALMEQPRMGAQYAVRVVPCLVLDTGLRQVHIYGDLDGLDAARLESALARR
jgi:hypothetical protein